MNIQTIQATRSYKLTTPLLDNQRNPDVSGGMLISWFEKAYCLDSVGESRLDKFHSLATEAYNCIIEVDDQIDRYSKDPSGTADIYIERIKRISILLGLSNAFRQEIDFLYERWMSAERKLKSASIDKDCQEMRQCYEDKTGFLKLVPMALGELINDMRKTSSIINAYGYASIANGYIDDLIDFDEDIRMIRNTYLSTGMRDATNAHRAQVFMRNYLKTAIKYKLVASDLFLSQGAHDWSGYCNDQVAGCKYLLEMLETRGHDYVLKNSGVYLKGT